MDNSDPIHLEVFKFISTIPIGKVIDTVYGTIERSSELSYEIEFKDLDVIEHNISHSMSIMGQ